jgi:hypothetical protein
VSFGKLIEVALDENGTKSSEAHDPGPCFDRAGRRRANASDVLAQEDVFKTVRRNEGVDIKAPRLRAAHGCDLDVTDGPGRNPRENIPDLVVR